MGYRPYIMYGHLESNRRESSLSVPIMEIEETQ